CPEHRFAVLEMGAQRVGEIALLCRIAPPDIGVVTVIGPEHLEFFGSMAHVISAESEVVLALSPDGIAVLNEDDEAVRAVAQRTQGQVVTYGRLRSTDVRAAEIAGDPLTGLRFTLTYHDAEAPVHLNIPGEHAVSVALAAAAVALSCGMKIEAVAQGLGEL